MNQEKLLLSLKNSFKSGLELVRQKNEDYGDPNLDAFKNFRSAAIVGVDPKRAILVRVLDKLSRAGNLLEKVETVENEKVTDTILDAINYLGILKAYIEDENEQKISSSRVAELQKE